MSTGAHDARSSGQGAVTDSKKIDDGGPAWNPIATADKDADRMLLGIVRNDVLEEVHIGGYRYAINDDEVSCWWSDQADDEIVPTHWTPMIPFPALQSKGEA